jgi:hypothetical protein
MSNCLYCFRDNFSVQIERGHQFSSPQFWCCVRRFACPPPRFFLFREPSPVTTNGNGVCFGLGLAAIMRGGRLVGLCLCSAAARLSSHRQFILKLNWKMHSLLLLHSNCMLLRSGQESTMLGETERKIETRSSTTTCAVLFET